MDYKEGYKKGFEAGTVNMMQKSAEVFKELIAIVVDTRKEVRALHNKFDNINMDIEMFREGGLTQSYISQIHDGGNMVIDKLIREIKEALPEQSVFKGGDDYV